MFFDFPEIVIIFGVALVVLGPKKLPGTAAQIGRWVGRARAMARQFREQLEQEVGSVESALDVNATRQPAIHEPAPSIAPHADPAASTGVTGAALEHPASFPPPDMSWHPEFTDSEASPAPYGDPNAIPQPDSGAEASDAQLSLQLGQPGAAAPPEAPAAAAPPPEMDEPAAVAAGAAEQREHR